MSDSTAPPESFETVAVVGAGLMGHGIGVDFAVSGLDVTLYDADEDVLADSGSQVRSALETLERNGRIEDVESVSDRVSWNDSLPAAVAGADLVVEAVIEDAEIKQTVFESIDEHAPADAVLSTNTSGLSITEISEAVSDPGRVVGTHWFNPPYIVPLVEVVEGEHTSDAVVEATYDFLEATDKTAVRVRKDITGFIGNRIQLAMAYEAFSLLERGVASAEEIDKAVKAGFGFRLPALGIFEKVDQSGLEVHHEVEKYLMPELDRGTDPSPVLEDLIEEGRTGIRSGRGIYDWGDSDPEEVYEKRDETLLSYLETFEAVDSDPE
jgi:3-hydroxybutyryl-CoA dehydrogenase